MLLMSVFVLLYPVPDEGFCHEPRHIIDEIRTIESNEIKCDLPGKECYGYIEGSIPILISAPHGTKHYRGRENRWKTQDAYTSSLAIELGRITGAHVLYAKNRTAEDPNNDIRSRYKDLLGRIVKDNGIGFVLDLHGAGRDRPFKIDIGVMDDRTERSSCPTFQPVIAQSFHGFQDRIFNMRFRARSPATITYFARNGLGIEAAQIEINARYRDFGSDLPSAESEEEFLELFGRLRDMILAINGKMNENGNPRVLAVSKPSPAPRHSGTSLR
jgi:hypothetical protein